MSSISIIHLVFNVLDLVQPQGIAVAHFFMAFPYSTSAAISKPYDAYQACVCAICGLLFFSVPVLIAVFMCLDGPMTHFRHGRLTTYITILSCISEIILSPTFK